MNFNLKNKLEQNENDTIGGSCQFKVVDFLRHSNIHMIAEISSDKAQFFVELYTLKKLKKSMHNYAQQCTTNSNKYYSTFDFPRI